MCFSYIYPSLVFISSESMLHNATSLGISISYSNFNVLVHHLQSVYAIGTFGGFKVNRKNQNLLYMRLANTICQ